MRASLAGIIISIAITAALAIIPVSASAATPSTETAAQSIRTILMSGGPDFAEAQVAFEKLVDPAVDTAGTLRQIDRMVQTIESMAGPSPSNRAKLEAVRKYIYESGEWNGHNPFRYDMSDPLGAKLSNRLLSTYIASRRGNCVSMPVLFLILADRLGLPVTLSTAPLHMFVKYTDDVTGQILNLETTSGAHPARAAWYRQKMPMTDEAVANGVYLKALSRKEALAVMASIVLDAALDRERFQDAIAIAKVLLESYPTFAYAMVKQGTAYGGLIEQEFVAKYPRPIDIPPALLPRYRLLAEQNSSAFAKAEALGWRED